MNNNNPSAGTWREYRKTNFTPEEIEASNKRVSVMIKENRRIGSSWSDFEKETFTPEEIAECEAEAAKIRSFNVCPKCNHRTLSDTMTPNDSNDPRFGYQICGEICSNCGYEHYDNEDE